MNIYEKFPHLTKEEVDNLDQYLGPYVICSGSSSDIENDEE